MTNIEGLPFSFEELQAAVDAGRVYARPHLIHDYTIYNYSDEVTFSNVWDDIVMNCRGLILHNETHKIIARPWKKFFNLGQMALPIQFDTPVEVMDKADGSLGILYPLPGKDHAHAISTRGSFHSEQADHATKVWQERYAQYDAAVSVSGWTFLFEIIYPENRIVLQYDDMDDLILLGAVDTKTGWYYGPREAAGTIGWTGPVIEVFEYNTLSDALSHTDRDNAEGFVVRSHNYLVKVKQPDYIELHRLRFNMNPKRIWEALADGKDLKEIVAPLPDEFQDDILEIGVALEKQFVSMYVEIARDFESIKGLANDRRAFAAAAQKVKHTGPMFTLLDGKSIDSYIWKMIKPKGSTNDEDA